MLCKANKATKTESHILSKFLGKELKKNNNRLKLISSDLRNKTEQDLPKFDYLYCYDCEKKFEIIETEVSRFFMQINKKEYISNFNSTTISSESYLTRNIRLDPIFLYLFVYIQVWRTASFVNNLFDKINNIDKIEIYKLFEYFRLGKETEEQLRIILNENLFLNKSELLLMRLKFKIARRASKSIKNK